MENIVLQVGIIILTGYLVGLMAQKLGFPRVTGYILAGLLLNPYVLEFVIHRSIIGKDLQMNSNVLISLALAIITFEVGGSLAIGAMKRLGKAVMYITIFEAEMAFLFVTLGLFTFFHFTGLFGGNTRIDLAIAFIMGALAAPTDPSATLAVMKEYKAHGEVSSMIMMVAAFDDVLGIINFSIASGVSAVLLSGAQIDVLKLVTLPAKEIIFSILLGLIGGLIFMYMVKLIEGHNEDSLILPVVVGMLFTIFGLVQLLGLDSIMSVMTAGAVMVNWSAKKNQVFRVTDSIMELAFVIFFVISGMRLDVTLLVHAILISLVFIFLRILGKFVGVYVGASLGNTSHKVRKYTFGGLIPQGGIVVGLALVFASRPEFSSYGSLIVSIVIGSVVIHEIVGPIASRLTLKAAGEI